MRICLWHGWLLDGTGSNVYTAKLAEAFRAAGHDVLLVCQERHPDRIGFIDAAGRVDGGHVWNVADLPASRPGAGRAVVLRPEIGRLLPMFVLGDYEGWEVVKRFVDLTDAELGAYLDSNAAALRTAVEWHRSDLVIVGHAVPGPPIGLRALGAGRYAAKVHGSDLEYAIRPDPRYAKLAREGLEGATAITALSDDVLTRTLEFAPAVADRVHKVTPGVQTDLFRPLPRRDALLEGAMLLAGDADAPRGRPGSMEERMQTALMSHDAGALEALPFDYDMRVPEPDAAGRLRRLSGFHGSLVGSIGALILEKGFERMLEAVALAPTGTRGLVIGFGTFREWLAALVSALDAGDAETVAWLRETRGMQLELSAEEIAGSAGFRQRVDFTGLLDHRYAPFALAALDVLVVPSTLKEAFGIVAAEGAASGALPLVSRHSGLAEVAAALEGAVDRPGWFSFQPAGGATRRLSAALTRLLELPPEERAELRRGVVDFVCREWTWQRAAERVLAACAPTS